MIGYRKNLERDLKRWREMNIIGPDAEAAIRSDVATRDSGVTLVPVLAILGAVLLCFAAMTFVAANWQEMSRLARLALLFGGLWGAYAGAWFLQRAAMPYFAEAAILLGVGLFGASIMLIAQMYHIEGDPPGAVLTWAGGSLLAGVLLYSRPALALAIALVSLWSWWDVTRHGGEVHWPFLAGWLAVAVPVLWFEWRTGYHLLAIALGAWIVGLGYQLEFPEPYGIETAHLLVFALGLGVAATGLAARRAPNRFAGLAEPLLLYGLAVAYAGLFALQIVAETSVWGVVLFAVLSLALIVATLVYALRADNRALTGMAYLLFSTELLALYFRTLGTLLDTALFFLLAGVIVIALAGLAWRLTRKQQPTGGVAP